LLALLGEFDRLRSVSRRGGVGVDFERSRNLGGQ
jgi:hypothetical protein